MAPNGKPSSYALQQRRSPLHSPVHTKDSVKVKKECILFSQSVMNGWNPNGNQNAPMENVGTNIEGPEPRVLSKKRRDLINAEIRELQNLLPLKKSARERLSYLGILALTNTYIRKATFFKKECISGSSASQSTLASDFATALSGFLLVFNREGKILYSSDNILDYLGHTVVELASQGDSIYDFVDKEDHDMIRSQLEIPPQNEKGEARKLSFYCKMSTSRYMKTQMRSWKNKIVHVVGKYHKPEMNNDWSDTVCFALCTPIESKPVSDVRHHPTPRPTEFKCLHAADMKFLEVSPSVASLLGYEPEELLKQSWYQWVYPEDLHQARQQHMKFVKEDASAFACVIRMIHKQGHTVWMDITAEKSQESIANTFICNYIAITEDDVPYFRLHHNLLPFPEHYSDLQRQILCANSTLLSNAVNNDANMNTQSPSMTPSLLSPSSPSHMMSRFEADPKSILRRQLMKRKMGSSLDSSFSPPVYNPDIYASGMEFFNIPPPNKMLIRRHTSSDMLYPTAGPSTMYPNNIPYSDVQSHSIFMPPPLIHETQYQPNLYDYSRPIAVPVSQEMQSPSPPRSSCSPESRHTNQNNNSMIQNDMLYGKPTLSPQKLTMQSSKTEYMGQGMMKSPQNIMQSPAHSYQSDMSPMTSPQQLQDQYQQEEFFSDVTNIVDCSQKIPSYDQKNLAIDLGNLISSYEEQFSNENKPTYSSCAIGASSPQSCGGNMGQLDSPMSQNYNHGYKSPTYEQGRLTHQINYNQAASPQHTHSMCGSPIQSPQMNSPQPASPDQRYHVQYSISSQNMAPQRSYLANLCPDKTATRFATNSQSGDWLRKFSHMSATEMLFCEPENTHQYYG